MAAHQGRPAVSERFDTAHNDTGVRLTTHLAPHCSLPTRTTDQGCEFTNGARGTPSGVVYIVGTTFADISDAELTTHAVRLSIG